MSLESRPKLRRIVLAIVLVPVLTMTVSMPIGILGSSNLVWGEANQYGRVKIPSTTVVRLPAGDVQVSVAIFIPGVGNATADLPLPDDLALKVTPVAGGGPPAITRDVGASQNAAAPGANTQRTVWRLRIKHGGDFRVTAAGNFVGLGVRPELWFGHGPPLPGTAVPLIALAIVAVGYAVWVALLLRARRRAGRAPRTPASAPT